jgi:preprotein translocase SecE subunit
MASTPLAKPTTKPKGDGFLKRLGRFLKESYVETRYKSSWPTWKELRQFTMVVIIAILVVSFWIGGIDAVLTRVTALLPSNR